MLREVYCAGHISVLQWLIRHGAKVEKDDLGGTPLHDAAEHGQKEVHYFCMSILLFGCCLNPRL